MRTRHGYLKPAIRLKWVLTIGSMCLSGLFGYITAEGVPVLNILLGCIFAGFAYGLAWAVEQRAFSLAVGDFTQAKVLLIMAALCGTLNAIADYSSSTAVRDIVSTKLGNMNRVTNDKVSEVKRLEKLLASDTQVVSFTAYTGAGAPRFFLSLSAGLERPNLWSARKSFRSRLTVDSRRTTRSTV